MIYKNYTTVKNCEYITDDGLYIGCEVTFDELGVVIFTASLNDSTEHGIEIYNRAKNGEFGPIKDYVPFSTEINIDDKIAMERSTRDQLLRAIDSIVSNPLRWSSFTPEEQDEIAKYRLALLDVPQQDGFPTNIVWPTPPDSIAASIKPIDLGAISMAL
jgi:hypothetical protein